MVAGEEAAIDWLFWFIFVGVVGAVQAMAIIVLVILMKKGGLFSLLMFRLRGGSLIIKADRDNSIEFGTTSKPLAVTSFSSWDERGIKKQLTTRIGKIKHHLKGTSKPVHVCVVGKEENVSLLQEYKPDKSSAFLNQWGQSLFQEGLNIGRALKEEISGFFKWDAGTMFNILIVCGLIIILSMQWITMNNVTPAGG